MFFLTPAQEVTAIVTVRVRVTQKGGACRVKGAVAESYSSPLRQLSRAATELYAMDQSPLNCTREQGPPVRQNRVLSKINGFFDSSSLSLLCSFTCGFVLVYCTC